MIPFSELQSLADKLRAKTGMACNISVNYWAWRQGGSKLTYELYLSDYDGNRKFETVQEFKAAVNNILNPPKDTGVKVSTKKEG